LLAAVLGFGAFGLSGCSEPGSTIQEGTIPADAPKSSKEAMEKMKNMAPAGADKSGKGGGSRSTMPPPPPPAQ